MIDIKGIIPHRRLMELKNCGAIKPDELEILADIKYLLAMDKVVEGLKEANRGFNWQRLWFYNGTAAYIESRLMFPDRGELINHLMATNGRSYLIPISDEDVFDLLFIDRAARAAKICKEVIDCFKNCNEVIASPEVSEYVNWLINNADKVRKLVATEEEAQ